MLFCYWHYPCLLAQTIVDKSKQVSKLVSRLLLLARIDQNRQKFNKEKVDLGVIIDVAVDSMKELAAQKEILLFANVPEGTIVDADESLLLSAITNLISNGIKYGNKSGYVAVSASKIGDRTKIIVLIKKCLFCELILLKTCDKIYNNVSVLCPNVNICKLSA